MAYVDTRKFDPRNHLLTVDECLAEIERLNQCLDQIVDWKPKPHKPKGDFGRNLQNLAKTARAGRAPKMSPEKVDAILDAG